MEGGVYSYTFPLKGGGDIQKTENDPLQNRAAI